MKTESILHTLLAALLLIVVAGCDSSNPPDDPELDGTWQVVMLSDATGDLTELIDQAFNSITFTFDSDGSFEWNQDGVDDVDDDVTAGSFVLMGGGDELRVNLDDEGFTVQLDFDLSFEDDDRIRLETGASKFNEFAQSDFVGRMTLILERE